MREASERKVWPIYDAIDSRNYKLATKLAKSALQKHPNSKIIKVLQGVTLERMGKIDEALEIGREVCKSGDVDDSVLNNLTIIFKSAMKLDELTAYMERRAVSKAESAESLRALFRMCARTFSFLKMQQVAMKLFKKTADHKYVFCAVASIYLQCLGEGKQTMLQLAETMCKRCLKDKGNDRIGECGPDALLMYIEVLYRQKKYKEALGVLREAKGRGTRLLRSQLNMLEAVLCISCGEKKSAVKIFKEHLAKNVEDWHAAQVLVDIHLPGTVPDGGDLLATDLMSGVISINPLDKARLHLKSGGLGDEGEPAWGEALGLARELEEAAGASPKSRGPAITMLDVLARQCRNSSEGRGLHGEALGNSFASALCSFWERCGSNYSFFSDVQPFLSQLTPGSAGHLRKSVAPTREQLVAKLASPGSQDEGDILQRRKAFLKVVSSYEMDSFIMLLLQDISGAVLFEEMTSLLTSNSELFQGFDERENTVADPLVVTLASTVWRKRRREARDTLRSFLGILLTLESGRSLSPFNAPMLVGLSVLYGVVGASHLAGDCFWKLEVKHVQLETLGAHILLPCLLAAGNERAAARLCDKHRQFHTEHDQDAGDTFAMTFDKGTYLESVDFAGFKDRLARSAVATATAVERSAMSISQSAAQSWAAACHSLAEETRMLGKKLGPAEADSLQGLVFNQDLSMLPEWSPPAVGVGAYGMVEWWDEVRQGGEGTGPRWWQAANSAHSSRPEAVEYRGRFRAGVLRRHMLLSAVDELVNGSPKDLSKVDRCCTHIAQSLGLWHDGTNMAELDSAIHKGHAAKLQVFTLSVLAFTRNVAALVTPDVGAQARPNMDEAAAAVASNAQHLAELLSDGGPCCGRGAEGKGFDLFFGGLAVPFSNALGRDVCAWTHLCLQTCSLCLKEMKKAAKKGQKVPGEGESPVTAAKMALFEVARAHLQVTFALKTAAFAAAQADPRALASEWCAHLVPGDKVSWRGSSMRHSAAYDDEVVKSLVEEQQASLKMARERAGKFESAAQAILG